MVRIGFGVVLLIVGYAIGTHAPSSIHAGMMRVAVPMSYGKVVAGDSSSLWYEDASGTLRQVAIPSGNTIFTISRDSR
jgi:hypothetical protein